MHFIPISALLYIDSDDWRKSPGVPCTATPIFADRRYQPIRAPTSGMSGIGDKLRRRSPNVPLPAILYARRGETIKEETNNSNNHIARSCTKVLRTRTLGWKLPF